MGEKTRRAMSIYRWQMNMKISSKLLAIREKQIRTTLSYNYTFINIKKVNDNINVDKYVVKLDHLCITCGNAKQ